MLKITNLSVHYGGVRAVQNLSLEVNEGELIGLVGHNGAGKTTTLMAITGVLKPVSGDIALDGRSLVGLSPDAILRAGISLVPEGRRIFGRLSVGENLMIGTTAQKDRRKADHDIKLMLERFPVLERQIDAVDGPDALEVDVDSLRDQLRLVRAVDNRRHVSC